MLARRGGGAVRSSWIDRGGGVVVCEICREGECAPALKKGETEILACTNCGVRLWVPDACFSAESLYQDGYFSSPEAGAGYDDYAGLEASLRFNFAGRLSLLPNPAAGDRLLDLGAAYGFAADEAQRAGWRAFGLEVSHSVAGRAARVIPGRVVAANGLALPFADATFAIVTLWDVIEHLRDPHSAVAEIARVLRPGGRLVLTTGDVHSFVARVSGKRWHLYTLPEHLFFYTRQGLRRLLEAHGLSVESIRAEGARYTLGYLVERLSKSLFGWDARGSFGETKLGRLAVPVNLFDIVTVQAVRRSQ